MNYNQFGMVNSIVSGMEDVEVRIISNCRNKYAF